MLQAYRVKKARWGIVLVRTVMNLRTDGSLPVNIVVGAGTIQRHLDLERVEVKIEHDTCAHALQTTRVGNEILLRTEGLASLLLKETSPGLGVHSTVQVFSKLHQSASMPILNTKTA